jgi:hypothetical protein
MPGDDKQAQMVAALQDMAPEERQDMFTAVYAMKYGKMGLDPSKYNQEKVSAVWAAAQQAMTQSPGQPVQQPSLLQKTGALGREAVLGAASGSGIPESPTPVHSLLTQMEQPLSWAQRLDPTAGALTTVWNMGKAGVQAASDIYQGVKSHDYEQAAHGLGAGVAEAFMLKGLHEIGAHPVTEIKGSDVSRATPITETGKAPTPIPSTVVTGGETPGVNRKGPSFGGLRETPAVGPSAPPPLKLVSDLKGFPEQVKTPTTPEIEPRVEVRSHLAARVAESVPNPSAGLEPSKLTAQAPDAAPASPEAILAKPERPPGRPQDNPEAFQQYARDRDDYMKQEAANRRLATVKPPKPTGAKEFDSIANRIIKAKDPADLAGRQGELQDFVERSKALEPEKGMQLAKDLRDRATATTQQAEELRRVAAAPQQIAQLMDQKGGQTLFGKWERVKENLTEEQIAEGQVARTRNVDISGVDPSARDMYHKLLGHPTTEVLTRDESGAPVKIIANDEVHQQAIQEQLAAWTSERAQMFEDLRASVHKEVTPEEMAHAQHLTDVIEEYSGLRDRLATKGPRKGQPEVSPMGVVTAPGAIPDLGRTTSNALMDAGPLKGPRKNVNASPERLLKKADQFDRATQLYTTAANAIEKYHGEAHDNPHVEVPPAKSVAQVSRETVPAPPPVDAASERAALVARIKELEAQAGTTAKVLDAEGKQIGTKTVVPGAAPEEHTSATLGRPDISLETDRKAVELWGKPYAELSKRQQLTVDNSAILKEAGKSTELERLQTRIGRLEAAPVNEPRQPFNAKFPMGEVSDTVRTKVEAAHLAALPESADVLSRAVAGQGLATRDAAYRLYGRALHELEDVKPGTEEYARAMNKAMDVATRQGERGILVANFIPNFVKGMKAVLNKPSLKSDIQGEMRVRNSTENQYVARVTKALKDTDKYFSRLPDAKLVDVVRHTPEANTTATRWFGKNFADLSRGEQRQIAGFNFQKDLQSKPGQTAPFRLKYPPNSPEYKLASQLRGLLDEGARQIEQAKPGSTQSFHTNYFPQDWVGVKDSREFGARVKGSLTAQGMLKQRYYSSLQAGEDANLRPTEWNPARAVLNKLIQEQHFIKGLGLLDFMQKNGGMGHYLTDHQAPVGWEELDKRVAGPNQYAPAPYVKAFNRYFEPGFLTSIPGVDTIRMYNHAMLQSAVAISGFHPILVTLSGMATNYGLLMQRSFDILRHPIHEWQTGQMSKGLPKAMANAIPLYGQIRDIMQGVRGNENWRTADNRGVQLFDELKLGQKGGIQPGSQGLTDIPRFRALKAEYTHAAVRAATAMRQGEYVHAAGEAWRAANAKLKYIPAAMNVFNSPVMNGLVNNAKLGTAMNALEYELDRLGPGASEAEQRHAAARVSDAMDNRFGQMVKDNLFWHNDLRGGLTLAGKFVDFFYGTLREGVGAVKDIPGAVTGDKLGHSLGYAMGLALTWGTIGSVMNYLLTGEAPKDKADMFLPRTGRVDSYGKPERLVIHGYERNYYQMAKTGNDAAHGRVGDTVQDLVDIARNREAPVVDLLKDWITNRNFEGAQVVNKNDPTIVQLWSMLKDATAQGQPISIGAAERATQLGGGRREQALAMMGIQPTPRYMSPDITPAESELTNQLRIQHGSGLGSPQAMARQQAIARLTAAERNNSPEFSKIWQEEQTAGHVRAIPGRDGKTDLDVVRERATTPFISRVKELSLPGAVDVMEKAKTPAEWYYSHEAVTSKLDQLQNMSEKDREALWQRISAANKPPQQVQP